MKSDRRLFLRIFLSKASFKIAPKGTGKLQGLLPYDFYKSSGDPEFRRILARQCDGEAGAGRTRSTRLASGCTVQARIPRTRRSWPEAVGQNMKRSDGKRLLPAPHDARGSRRARRIER